MLDIGAGGSAIGTLVFSGGVETVSSGGVANGTTVSSGGVQGVLSGGAAIGTTVSAGGNVTVDADRVTLREALTQVLKPFEKLSFMVDENEIFVSNRRQVEATVLSGFRRLDKNADACRLGQTSLAAQLGDARQQIVGAFGGFYRGYHSVADRDGLSDIELAQLARDLEGEIEIFQLSQSWFGAGGEAGAG